MNRSLLAVAASIFVLTGCDGFKEAMTAHVDVAARAGSQELSVDRLADLLGTSRIPISEDNAKALSNIWVDYQLLGEAAAKGDSLTDESLIGEALWPIISQRRASKWYEQVSKTWAVDTTVTDAKYAQGELLSAQHILFMLPEQSATPGARDSVRRVAESVRGQVTAANFADMARLHSTDPGSKERGGMYYAFPRGTMVKEFEQAVTSLQPGEIAPGLVQTSFGFHIIRRPTFAEVKDEYGQAAAQQSVQAAESTYFARLLSAADVEFRKDAAATIRKVIADIEGSRDDRTVIATTKAGPFTSERFARWLGSYPPQQQQMMRAQVGQAPDSLLTDFVKRQFVQNELILKQADSAKVTLAPEEMAELRSQFSTAVERTWTTLGIAPKTLADSANTASERQRLAAAHIDRYMTGLVTDQVQFVDVPAPVKEVLREKYDYKVNQAGISRSLEQATAIRAKADSARTAEAAQTPQSQVPLPPQVGQEAAPPVPQPDSVPSKQP
ncbi:MAG: peptidylprolyl isomerase [Gemmatimonadota bacterium]|nr:peptidylprolyl isomerase [Gemmatimonadota bacterium]